ncbi:glycoside hydrolase family 65 protein [Agrococcus sp. HG114]|uniref:glycoside hydrolase family 65 protein n=1 Tax=Agrococcus sp. HG114 TaxID=2969757 RepID=UPI00215B09AC|nr:glycosyl hydrolase family 65 protein [Agrococcus sp. HG114]MCR8671397.1 family 65 glycosyl hydrolase [Agrococcus sp. HG114]
MTGPLGIEVDPWSVPIRGVDASRLAHRESLLALSNGHIGWRGSLDEGDPRGEPGTYLNGVFEERPMPYAEEGYGYPSVGQSVINVANGQLIRLLVDDEPFDVRSGRLDRHEQRLDLLAGTLERDAEWTSPVGRSVRVRSTRLVSYTHRSIAAVRYAVEALSAPVTVTVRSELLANESLEDVHPDPRVQEALTEPLQGVLHAVRGTAATLVHRTRRSRLGIGVAMDHVIAGAGSSAPAVSTDASADLARTTITAVLAPGERLEIVKVVGHEWSADLAPATLRDRAEGAVADAVRDGWDALVAGQRERLAEYWRCADIEVDGSPRLQQAARFALFHAFQQAVRLELRSVPGKGLTGTGYEGHTFWDCEAFVLPLLTSTLPEAAAQALRWRHATLGHARRRAAELRLAGASFAWRTIDGRESSGYWPASTAAFHVNADIAAAVLQHVRATGDEALEREVGLELLVETARLWLSLGRWDERGGFHLDGVTGPDEYSALADDNVYTNLAARVNLAGAADAARRHRDVAIRLGVRHDEIERWAKAAAAMTVPFDEELGVHPQSAGFTAQERWDFERTGSDEYPLQDRFPYVELYRKQVVKQADLVLAQVLWHEAFTPAQKARDFAYYEALTVRDSSLSAVPQAVIAAELGHLDLAADYLAEAATIDLDDAQGDTAEGLHLASLAGTWTAVVAGFGGMRASAAGLRFSPRLPRHLTRLSFGIRVDGRVLRVEIHPDRSVYRLDAGAPLRLRHFDEELEVEAGRDVEATTPPLEPLGPAPRQPRHRAPRSFADALGDSGLSAPEGAPCRRSGA